MTPSEPLRLHHGEHTVEIAPAVGGSIAAYYSHRGGARFDWLRPAPAGSQDVLAMASFPMLPFCNRLRDGRSRFGPRAVVLPAEAAWRHPLHGMAWRMPWRVDDAGPHGARLSLLHPHGAWPYRFRAEQHLRLDAETGLLVELTVRNDDDVPMPLGVGHHPYLPLHGEARLQLRARAMWEADDEVMPTKLAVPTVVGALAGEVAVDTLALDNNFVGWDGRATVRWPRHGASLALLADRPLDCVTLYTPHRDGYFCVEPVSNTTDWMNLALQGVGDVGGTMLAPGASLRTRMQLAPRWA